MTATNSFFRWFYYGLNGLGGWFLFFLVALGVVIWLLYDSYKRRLPALGWRMGVVIAALLLTPAILYRFTITSLEDLATSPLAPFSEPIFYLGILGGILPIILAIGYFVSYQGLVACPQGHLYEDVLGQCPHPDHQPVIPPPQYDQRRGVLQAPPPDEVAPLPPRKRKVQAWLVAKDGHTHQLCEGETTIGRASQSDIVISGDTTVGRQHAKITEQNGRFRLIDLGAKNFTRLNGRVMREPTLLEPDDEIQFGENSTLRFVTSRQ